MRAIQNKFHPMLRYQTSELLCLWCRQTALQQIAQLLLMFMCTPAAPADTTHPASPPLTPRQPAPSQVMIDIPANDPAHVTIRMPSPQGTASPTPASTPRTAAENQQDRLVSNSSCIVMRPDCINLPAQHGHKDSRSQAKMSL